MWEKVRQSGQIYGLVDGIQPRRSVGEEPCSRRKVATLCIDSSSAAEELDGTDEARNE
jgi:hypothetical protein